VVILLGLEVAIAHFTKHCTCSAQIVPDIVLAADQFYQMLPLLPHHFTRYYTCSASILPDIVLAADEFYQVLPLLPNHFTGCYTCSR
jgi:hypothetical protein